MEKDLVYGKAINYVGDSIELKLDLYKPVGDSNPARPIFVCVHGGFMLTGCKEGMAWLAEEMAARGYVVASVNYRKGWHKASYVLNPNCLLTGLGMDVKCLYAADSAEHYRAIYRGMQDVKGAIRWLKARALQDSTDHKKVIVGGESAGGFISMAVAFLDRPEEKPASCYALPAAPKPYGSGVNCFEGDGCRLFNLTLTGPALLRPDLGSIEGHLNLNGHNANVVGVFSFYGGVPYEAHVNSRDWLRGPDTPAIYLFHQTCDGTVPFVYGQPFDVISVYCNAGCDPWHYPYMRIFGSGAIANALEAIPNPPPLMKEFFDCPPFNPNLALFECLRYADNGGYHRIIDQPKRARNMANFFNPLVCNTTAVSAQAPDLSARLRIQPNPFDQQLAVWVDAPFSSEAQLWLSDVSGQVLWSARRFLSAGHQVLLEQNDLPSGVYFLYLRSSEGAGVWKTVRK
ncbi:MAG: alpha/beta hydrolase fold domain-containing protein [Saprospiraceae bacterium]|nr:alpha/beta hydrolase fold domain-containing protein [Saprospiraceae bacterium]